MSKWFLTDASTCQYVRSISEENGIYELIDTFVVPPDQYAVVQGTVTIDPTTIDEEFVALYLRPYGYESFAQLQQEYGTCAKQIAAECAFETSAWLNEPSIFKGTEGECFQYIETLVERENHT